LGNSVKGIDQRNGYCAISAVFSEIDYNFEGTGIDVAHQRYLGIPLINIGLIDAQGIDPAGNYVSTVTQATESCIEIFRNWNVAAVAKGWNGECWIAPHVR
jgi:hypothetical protein